MIHSFDRELGVDNVFLATIRGRIARPVVRLVRSAITGPGMSPRGISLGVGSKKGSGVVFRDDTSLLVSLHCFILDLRCRASATCADRGDMHILDVEVHACPQDLWFSFELESFDSADGDREDVRFHPRQGLPNYFAISRRELSLWA